MTSRGALKHIPAKLALAAALAAFPCASRAADDPAKTLEAQFQAAKASLAAGDLASAESRYVETIVMGLRQVAQLALSQGEADRSVAYLASALTLKPDDVETQVDAAGVWFRKGETGKAKALLTSVVAGNPSHARARSMLGR